MFYESGHCHLSKLQLAEPRGVNDGKCVSLEQGCKAVFADCPTPLHTTCDSLRVGFSQTHSLRVRGAWPKACKGDVLTCFDCDSLSFSVSPVALAPDLCKASEETRLQMGWVRLGELRGAGDPCLYVSVMSSRRPKQTEDGPLSLLDRCCAPLQWQGPRCKPLLACNEEVT